MKKTVSLWHKPVKPLYSSLAIVSALVLSFVGANQLISHANAKSNTVTNKGFDELGYNRQARIFIGKADGIDKKLDGKVWGDSYYANDHLVMKWNDEWDRGNAEGWSDPNGYDAWENNEWNGQVEGGSGETWHYKIVWDRGCKDAGTPSVESVKGTVMCVWGQFAIVMSQGNIDGEHIWDALGAPNGYGASK